MNKIFKKIAAIGASIMMMSACVSGASAADTESYMFSKSQSYEKLTENGCASYRTMVPVVRNPRTGKSAGTIKGSYTYLAGAKTTTYSTSGACVSHYAIISSGGDSKYGKTVNSKTFSETRCLYEWGWNPTYTFKGVYTFYK